MIVFTLLLTFTCLGYSLCSQASFINNRLYSVNLNANQTLVNLFDTLSKQIDIDFWTQPAIESPRLDFRIAPKYKNVLENVLNQNQVNYTLLTDDLEKWIQQERIENFINQSMTYASNQFDINNFKIDYYHDYSEIIDYLEYLEKKYPQVADVINIGETFERNNIVGIKLGIPRDDNKSKPVFWIDAGIHAREWITPATALYFIYKLAEKHETDLDIRYLMNKYDWIIFPTINPDGYIYTRSRNRLWRKNRAIPKTRPIRFPWSIFTDCVGVDLNRNFDVGFGGYSTSSNPCSEVFKGDTSFSEKETRAFRDAIKSLGSSLKIYLSLHSYSQLWMSPYSHTILDPEDHQELNEMLKRVTKAVLTINGLKYRYGKMSTTIYRCGGTSVDWVYEKAKVKYSFTAELRDKGDFGFLLPRSQIVPTAQETWEGVKTIANEAKV